MTTHQQSSDSLVSLIGQYLGLESMEVTEVLLDLCGARIDTRALPLLKRRLQEEEAWRALCVKRGYIRMSEKSNQLVESITALITTLEQVKQKEYE